MLTFEAKNYLPLKSQLEIMTPSEIYSIKNNKMFINDQSVEVTHANNIVEIPCKYDIPIDSLIRIKLTHK